VKSDRSITSLQSNSSPQDIRKRTLVPDNNLSTPFQVRPLFGNCFVLLFAVAFFSHTFPSANNDPYQPAVILTIQQFGRPVRLGTLHQPALRCHRRRLTLTPSPVSLDQKAELLQLIASPLNLVYMRIFKSTSWLKFR
jgi:hypothetical protein